MSEPKPRQFNVHELSPEERAKLLAELHKDLPESKIGETATSNKTAEIKEETGKEVLTKPVEVNSQAMQEAETVNISESSANLKAKQALNQFLSNRKHYDDLQLDDDPAGMVDAINDMRKAA